MTALARILGLYYRLHRRAFLGGALLMSLAVAAGAALLGLSGWFITACGLAGAAGFGIAFDFFRPSAAIRFLALARTGARYAERLYTHDATLRFLASLRGRLFRGLTHRPFERLTSLRSASALHRLTSDVDALDALYLRLFAPMLSGALVLTCAGLLLGWLVNAAVALWIVLILGLGGGAVLWIGMRVATRDAAKRAHALEALRVRLLDLTGGRVELAIAGRLTAQRDHAERADAAAAASGERLDRMEILAALITELAPVIAAAGALLIGAAAALPGPQIAIGVLSAFALGEAIAPLARGALEGGRLLLAAKRIDADLTQAEPNASPASGESQEKAPQAFDRIAFEQVSFAWPSARASVLSAFSLTTTRGRWTALTGPSGGGKSTALLLAAGLLAPSSGRIRIGDRLLNTIPEAELRAGLAMLPQRSALFSGDIAQNLRLAAPTAEDEALVQALRDVCLWDVLAPRGGLALRLGEGGLGLSGGEARRLTLARLLLRAPQIVLLDEPTEGLEPGTAQRVLTNLRARLSGASVLCASHREVEIDIADAVRTLAPPSRENTNRKVADFAAGFD